MDDISVLESFQRHFHYQSNMGSIGFSKVPKPWISTPLKELSVLSRAAGW